MFGHFGFSYTDLIYLLMLFIPNIIWSKNLPKDYQKVVGNENKVLLFFERVGQMLLTCTAVIFRDFNINSVSFWSTWLVISFIIMIMYEINWIKYFTSDRNLKDFYSSFCSIPVAGATLPVVAFFLLGIYGKNIWLIISIIILGIGHTGIHLQHLKETKMFNK